MQTTGNLGLKKPEGTDIVDIADLNGNMDILDNAVTGKVDKVTGKQLSTNDYTTAEKTKLGGIATGANNYVHPNHTGDVISTGDGVTAIASGVIVDADVNATAGIAWSKLSKTGASLADLPTRSAADLSSGTLAAARLPAISGDITMAAGTSTAAITAGVIVNADVNAAAAIDASKIGTGVVSNAEFGYLDGVTSGIQGQLNGKAPLATTPQQTTADITYYVRTDGNDNNTGLANTAGGAFKTISKAVSMIPQVINHEVRINVAAGTYAEEILLLGYSGAGNIIILGSTALDTTRKITGRIVGQRCGCRIEFQGLNLTNVSTMTASYTSCVEVYMYKCLLNSPNSSGYGIYGENSNIFANECSILGRLIAVYAHYGTEILAMNCSGSANMSAYQAGYGGNIQVSGSVIGATSTADVNEGGIVTIGSMGIVNPWGDSTKETRPFGSLNHNPSAQTIAAGVWTKINLTGLVENNMGICDPANARFIIPQSGRYTLTMRMGFSSVSARLSGLRVSMYINGSWNCQLSEINGNSSDGIMLNGATVGNFEKGWVIEFYAQSDQDAMLSQSDVYSHVTMIRVA